jgi:CRISPR/Cas system-associated endonuclease Cas1
MQAQPTERADRGICVAHGYGLKLHVQRRHLIIEDGVGRQRRTRRYHRVTSKLRRVVVIGHTGYITLEALRWIQDVGAAFVQIDGHGNLIALSAPARHHEPKLRRAQVLAPESGLGAIALVALLKAKLEAQARLAERLSYLKPTVRVKKTNEVTVAAWIRDHVLRLHPELPVTKLRQIESAAGREYWRTWARLPVRFERAWAPLVPDHWHVAGPRTSQAENKRRARKATSPVHAILNYAYAILLTEATISCHAMGLDPSLGLMHVDLRYRSSLAADVMEPGRPVADALVLGLLQSRALRRGDIVETREGVCRVGPALVPKLAAFSTALRTAVAPHAEQLARTLSRSEQHPTPMTRAKHRRAIAQRAAASSP